MAKTFLLDMYGKQAMSEEEIDADDHDRSPPSITFYYIITLGIVAFIDVILLVFINLQGIGMILIGLLNGWVVFFMLGEYVQSSIERATN